MKYLKFLIFILLVASCSNSDSEGSIESLIKINSISPLRAKIGDTITITGSNLDKLSYVYFKHNYMPEDNNVKIEPYTFISRSNKKITFKIPKLVHENITIYLPNIDTGYNLDLVGFIPIQNDMRIVQSQTLTNEIAYLTDGEKIYKSTDGYYNWHSIYTIPEGYDLSSFYYLDENHCWIGVISDITGVSIFYSDNGGADFSLKFNVGHTAGKINKIKFFSLSKGFFVDNNQEMYVSDNTSFLNIYDYYPNLSLLPFGKIEIWDFNALNENLIFLSPNDTHFLIKIDNQNITYSEFYTFPSAPQIFNSIGYTQVESDIYKTTDLGNSWTKIKTFDNYTPDLHFFNENVGFAMVNYTPNVFYKTVNGGNTWIDYWTPSSFLYNNSLPTVTPKHVWLFGDLWKYIEE